MAAERAMAGDEVRGADCIVVGAGVSGLACALAVARQGFTVQVLEAGAQPGGRVRGGLHQGEPADIGFQTILRGYPQASAFLDAIGIGASQVRTFQRRIVLHDGHKWRRIKLVGPGGIATSGLIPRSDIARLARIGARAVVGGVRELDAGHDESAVAMFEREGVSPTTIDRVLRPLLGSMLLDRTLEADAGYVRFLLAMIGRGPAILPVDGMGMVVDKAVGALTAAGGMLWSDTPVEAISLSSGGRIAGVTLGDGRTVSGTTVVIATGASAARHLLAPVDANAAARVPTHFAGAVSANFALDAPLYREATLLLDAAGPEGTDRVDLICQTTNVTRPGSPGPHILVAQSATGGWSSVDPDRYADAVIRRLTHLIPGYDWTSQARLIEATAHPDALYRPTPGVRAHLPGPHTLVPDLFLAGDITTHPSFEGAISAGERAAELVIDQLT